MMFLINAIVWLIGFLCFAVCIGMLVLQKKKRSDDWKLIVGTGFAGFIWLMYVLSQIFG